MHLVDGGVLKDLLGLIRSVVRASGSSTALSNAVERHIKFLNKYRSKDQARELRYAQIA